MTSVAGQMGAAISLWFLFLFDFGMLLLPGVAVLAWIGRGRRWTPACLLALAIGMSLALGYVVFWVFFFQKMAGRVVCYLVYAAAVVSLRMRRAEVKRVWREIGEPIRYAALTGVFYLCLFFLFLSPANSGASYAGRRFFSSVQPGDNVIPMILGDRIYAQAPLRPFCCGDWLSSDRPPLQSAMYLLERPLRAGGSNDLNYELAGVGLQVLWTCGVWALLTALGTERRTMRQAMGLLFFSSFLFYNSVYTWPKLLAAALMLLGGSVLMEAIRQGRQSSPLSLATAGGCVGLALLAHPGCVFSLPAAGLAALRFRRSFSIRSVALGIGVVAALLLPWSAYQRFVDPPGNRLLKMHLAAHHAVDKLSFWESVAQAYEKDGFRKAVRYKLSNVETLWGAEDPVMHRSEDRSGLGRMRFAEREWILEALGILNLGWPAAVVLVWRRRRPAIALAGWLMGAAVLNLLVWSVAMYGPSATLTTHSSYPDIFLLGLGLAGFLLALPRAVYGIVLGLQMLNLLVVWVAANPLAREWAGKPEAGLQIPLLAAAVAIGAAAAWQALGPGSGESAGWYAPAPRLSGDDAVSTARAAGSAGID